MSNGLATFKMIYSQLTCVDTEILPDREEFAFIACGDLQYSFTLLGGGCFCFHVCVPCARIGIFIHAFRLLIPSQAYSAVLFIHPLLKECIDLDMEAEITTLRFCKGHIQFN